MKAALVLTSIHDCTELLDGYLKNFSKYGHEVKIYLIPDAKTPRQEFPGPIDCPPLAGQNDFLNRVGFSAQNVPMNSDNRRNVGYLMALADGAEMVVSIDDDNFCPEEDFIEQHREWMCRFSDCRGSTNGWLNNCDLHNYQDVKAYPRGFPYYAKREDVRYEQSTQKMPIYINAGMWLQDPDLDAMTWLHRPFYFAGWSGMAALALDTWCPINSQNTAVHRKLMPAYYFIRMVPPSDRFGDIFQGYFALKVAKHMGWTARFGSPVVTHRRTSHVYLKDVEKEIGPILMLEEFLPKLIEHKLAPYATNVTDAYLSLAEFVESQDTDFYRDTARLMRQWAETCRRIG